LDYGIQKERIYLLLPTQMQIGQVVLMTDEAPVEQVFYLGECLVSWLSKKQSSISLSTAEAEYIAATTCCTQVLWMKQTLTDIQVEYDEPIPIYCDNTSTISISKNPVMHSKTKHIPIKYHFLWEQVAEKNIRVEYVGTKEQVVDIFTKPLPWEAFEYLRQRLRVISTPK
jgi:hypothetical protein